MSRIVAPLTDAQRAEFLAVLRSHLGARWGHQGRRASRMDCIGLVVLSLQDIGVKLEDRTDYGRTPSQRRLSAALTAHFGEPVCDLQPGDVVTMRWTGEENHVAVITDHPHGLGVIHCYAIAPGGKPGGRVIEHRLSPDWRDLILEAWRP